MVSSQVKFWKDRWLGSTTLHVSYPRLYQIASNQDSFVSQYRDNNVFCPQFRRNLQDWEINDLLKLLATLAEYRSGGLHTKK